MMRSLFLLPTIREELDTIFSINPRSVRGHALAGNLFFELPGMLGGDRKKAEEHFRKRSEEHTSELQSRLHLVCRLLLEKNKNNYMIGFTEYKDTDCGVAPVKAATVALQTPYTRCTP